MLEPACRRFFFSHDFSSAVEDYVGNLDLLRPNILVFGKKKKEPPEVRPGDEHLKHVCKISGSISLDGVDIWTFARKSV